MALLHIINLKLFPNVCTYYHSHVLWADIVGCDAKQLVKRLENLPTEHFMPFTSFAGKNFGKDMNKVLEPPCKKTAGHIPPDTTLQHYVKKLQPILSNHIHLNDTIFNTSHEHIIWCCQSSRIKRWIWSTKQSKRPSMKANSKKWQCQHWEPGQHSSRS